MHKKVPIIYVSSFITTNTKSRAYNFPYHRPPHSSTDACPKFGNPCPIKYKKVTITVPLTLRNRKKYQLTQPLFEAIFSACIHYNGDMGMLKQPKYELAYLKLLNYCITIIYTNYDYEGSPLTTARLEMSKWLRAPDYTVLGQVTDNFFENW